MSDKRALTVTKTDLKHVLDELCCPTHYAIMLSEITEVYINNIDMTLTDMLKPFAKQKISQKIPARNIMRNPENIKYSDYIIPLFFTAYICKNEQSDRIIKEILCMILKDYGHFHYPKEIRGDLKELYGKEWNDPHHYWGFPYPTLTEKEKRKVADLYWDYVRTATRNANV